jgi:hypothetical protein
MKKNIFFIGILSVLLLISSCGKKQHITVSRDRFLFDMNGGAIAFDITADCDWFIDQDHTVSWVSLSQTQGSHDGRVTVYVQSNAEQTERSTLLSVVSANGKIHKQLYVQQNTDINSGMLTGNIWFLRFYERWDLDYYNQIIDESYRSWTYYVGEDYRDWFFYFADTIGYLIQTYQGDTLYSPYHYVYYPQNDSLYLNFETLTDTIEDYYARIHELTSERFTLSNEYAHNRFEKLYTVNVTVSKQDFKINPAKIVKKSHGPIITIK